MGQGEHNTSIKTHLLALNCFPEILGCTHIEFVLHAFEASGHCIYWVEHYVSYPGEEARGETGDSLINCYVPGWKSFLLINL